jgi:hypothetical protein
LGASSGSPPALAVTISTDPSGRMRSIAGVRGRDERQSPAMPPIWAT